MHINIHLFKVSYNNKPFLYIHIYTKKRMSYTETFPNNLYQSIVCDKHDYIIIPSMF